jgi:hypothetical protein
MNAPYKPQIQRTPDIYLSGEAVEQILAALNNAVIFAKVNQDGSMRPFIDPTPIGQIIIGALHAALNPQHKEE